MKGRTREVVKRHSSTIIPLLSMDDVEVENKVPNDIISTPPVSKAKKQPRRKAAEICRHRIRQQLS